MLVSFTWNRSCDTGFLYETHIYHDLLWVYDHVCILGYDENIYQSEELPGELSISVETEHRLGQPYFILSPKDDNACNIA